MRNKKRKTREILEPELLIAAYEQGYFPMAESKDGEIYWHSPDPRAVIPLGKVRIPRSMRQILKKNIYSFTVNQAFDDVIRACSQRDDTWISDEITDSYIYLNRLGFAKSVEAWNGSVLAGGLYGVTLGGAFFGESMFSKESNASKAAFYTLADLLLQNGFELLDTQYINGFTKSLGAVEIPKPEYMKILRKALDTPARLP